MNSLAVIILFDACVCFCLYCSLIGLNSDMFDMYTYTSTFVVVIHHFHSYLTIYVGMHPHRELKTIVTHSHTIIHVVLPIISYLIYHSCLMHLSRSIITHNHSLRRQLSILPSVLNMVDDTVMFYSTAVGVPTAPNQRPDYGPTYTDMTSHTMADTLSLKPAIP